MLIEQPPLLYRLLFPEAIWRIVRPRRRVVYLTFDDGPIPEQTPWVLDILDRYGIKATFFLVGDNVRRHPELLDEIRRRGHSYGNHTMHHLQGMKTTAARYIADVDEANRLIDSTLFRPPHGIMRWKQSRILRERYNIIMYDLVTRDYSAKLSPEQVLDNVRRFTRNGSIIVFHDSLKAADNLRAALPRAIEWLLSHGYEFEPISMQ
ncbi:MAG: polysaccharide deacetylase family protein [Muribaculaceae bacterium]|nr:polysaccharide deacetylase family protein [Muribaculaceae bacterium]